MLFPEQQAQRVLNMAVYFVTHTENCDRKKLRMLFYFADKLAIERMAFPISDAEYIAEEDGPMPVFPYVDTSGVFS